MFFRFGFWGLGPFGSAHVCCGSVTQRPENWFFFFFFRMGMFCFVVVCLIAENGYVIGGSVIS